MTEGKRSRNRKLICTLGLAVLCVAAALFALWRVCMPEKRPLTQEEIGRVNAAFEPMIPTGPEGTLAANPISYFFTSYYEVPTELDLGAFVAYMPKEPCVPEEDGPFMQADMPNGRITFAAVEGYLQRYMGLTLDKMDNWDNAVYSEDYETFYSSTSDFELGTFVCTGGEVAGHRVLLYSDAATLTLQKRGGGYRIVSHVEVPKRIYLYGEAHSVGKILDRELALWASYYEERGMRHLFVEYPYYTAELLNLWMQADSDEILDAIYEDWAGSAAYSPLVREFYRELKRLCPETVFHGTDVGHQFLTTGERYLGYLRKNGMEDTEQYRLAQACIEQGRTYYQRQDAVYRENRMAENFIRAFDALEGESIVGFYGAAHTGTEDMDYTGQVPSMANQLHQRYGGMLYTEDLSWMEKDIAPLRMDSIVIAGREYEASYFGEMDLRSFSDTYTSRAYWRVEDAYADLADSPATGDVLPYNNYPMLIVPGQIFALDYTRTDGTLERMYFRADEGAVWNGMPTTVGITVEG